jgi:hypothetical protein
MTIEEVRRLVLQAASYEPEGTKVQQALIEAACILSDLPVFPTVSIAPAPFSRILAAIEAEAGM